MAVVYNTSIVTDGLVLCLDAGNPKSYPGSGTAWNDLSGTGKNGTLTNGPTYSSANGGAVVFDGTNDFVDIPSFNVSGTQITIGAWFRFTTLQTGERAIIRKNNIWQLGFINPSIGGVRCLLGTNGTTGWTASNDFTQTFLNNTWYYFAFTYNNGTTRFYLNGSNIRTITTITGSILSDTTDIAIGANTDGATLNIAANVAIAHINNVALDASQMSQNFNALRGRFGI